MDTVFLESLLSVAQHRSIAAAARQQNLTTSAVRQRIKTLEGEFDTVLFRRAGRKMVPTPECIQILPDVQKLLADGQRLRAKFMDVDMCGEIRIGAITSAMPDLIAPALKNLKQELPDVRVDIRPGTSQQLYDSLLAEELDLIVAIQPPFDLSKELASVELGDQSLTLITPDGVTGRVQDILLTHPYIRYDPDSWGGRLAEKYLKDQKIKPDLFCTLDNPPVIPLYVEWGFGVSLIPDWGSHWMQGLSVRQTKITGAKYHRQIAGLYRRHCETEKLIERFLRPLMNVG